MRVIQHGNRIYYRDIEHVCEICGCKYRFNLADISYKIDYKDDENKFIPCNFVVCPECKGIYILNQEEENEEPAGGGSEDPNIEPVDPEDVNPPDPTDPDPDPEPDPEPVDPDPDINGGD